MTVYESKDKDQPISVHSLKVPMIQWLNEIGAQRKEDDV